MPLFDRETPEGMIEEILGAIERKPANTRTAAEAIQMDLLAEWFTEACRSWGCRRYEDVWREGYRWIRDDWTSEQRDHAIRVVRAARAGFVLARVPKARLSVYRFDGMERWFVARAKELVH